MSYSRRNAKRQLKQQDKEIQAQIRKDIKRFKTTGRLPSEHRKRKSRTISLDSLPVHIQHIIALQPDSHSITGQELAGCMAKLGNRQIRILSLLTKGYCKLTVSKIEKVKVAYVTHVVQKARKILREACQH